RSTTAPPPTATTSSACSGNPANSPGSWTARRSPNSKTTASATCPPTSSSTSRSAAGPPRTSMTPTSPPPWTSITPAPGSSRNVSDRNRGRGRTACRDRTVPSRPPTPVVMPPRRPNSTPSVSERGFALLITITLVAFLVLILVSIATLTRVETQVAANSQQLSQARQNPRMARNIAIGQLQKYAGPGQRVTARADLENPAGTVNTHWVGVYGSSVAADYNDTPVTIATALTDSANVSPGGSSARLLNWLVSGNEATAFDPRRGVGDVGDKGQITAPPASIAFSPATSVTGLTPTTPATDPDIEIVNAAGAARPARLLVGANSVTSSLDSSGVPIDYVVAP